MESYRTEEEQVEALRKWWQDNAKSTIAAIVVALAGGYGWQAWQQHSTQQAEAASAVYQNLLDAVNVASAGQPLTDEQVATARHLAGQLKDQYGNSSYAQFAALQLARLAVNDNDLADAEAELRWVLTQNPQPDLQRVAQLRLARVVASQGDSDAALKMLMVDAGAYAAAYAEARGDIYLQMQQTQQALSAYQEAAELNLLAGSNNSGNLDLKLQSLQLQPARAESGGVVDAAE